MVDEAAAEAVTNAVNVPTIGIGAGAACDGQVLVCYDLLGLSQFTPSFVKKYADLSEIMTKAYSDFVADVRGGSFPEKK